MDVKPPFELLVSTSLALAFCLGPSGCSHSQSSEQSTPTSTTRASTAKSAANAGSSSEDSSQRQYRKHPEVERLESETERFRAQAEILEIKNAIQSRYVLREESELPDELSDLTEGEDPAVENREKLRDPWGKRYIFRKNDGEGIDIFSAGPDGEVGTEDDVRPGD